jgi:hypothetical protein
MAGSDVLAALPERALDGEAEPSSGGCSRTTRSEVVGQRTLTGRCNCGGSASPITSSFTLP